MGAWNYTELRRHIGHKIVCVCYTDDAKIAPDNVAIECEDCNEVLFDFDRPSGVNQ